MISSCQTTRMMMRNCRICVSFLFMNRYLLRFYLYSGQSFCLYINLNLPMAKFAAISALVVRLGSFGLFGPASYLNPQLVVLIIQPIHLFNRIVHLLIVAKDLNLSISYNESIIPNYSYFLNRPELTEQLFELAFPTVFREPSHINLWITHFYIK